MMYVYAIFKENEEYGIPDEIVEIFASKELAEAWILDQEGFYYIGRMFEVR